MDRLEQKHSDRSLLSSNSDPAGNCPTRRAFVQRTVESILAFSVLDTLLQRDLFADEIKPLTVKWLKTLNQLGEDVKSEKLKQVAWQKEVEKLFQQVDMAELLKYIDFQKLEKRVKLPDRGTQSLRFGFQDVDGTPKKLVFGRQIFTMKKGCSVVPHGHNNMATAFLVLKGQFHGRHYDRVEDQKDHLLIQPTIDRKFEPGACSTVSDHKDNIHWFKATTEPAFLFNIHVMGLNAGKSGKRTGRVYLDPNGEKVAGGLIRAPRISERESHRLYG